MQLWSQTPGSVDSNYLQQFESALNEDLDTFKVLQLIRTLEKDESIPAGNKYETILKFDEVLGLNLDSEPMKQPEIVITQEIQSLLDERLKARSEKNWKLSDEIRDKLINLGIGIKDSEKGSEVFPL
jgi:cysteinyl-tRNA synthetase